MHHPGWLGHRPGTARTCARSCVRVLCRPARRRPDTRDGPRLPARTRGVPTSEFGSAASRSTSYTAEPSRRAGPSEVVGIPRIRGWPRWSCRRGGRRPRRCQRVAEVRPGLVGNRVVRARRVGHAFRHPGGMSRRESLRGIAVGRHAPLSDGPRLVGVGGQHGVGACAAVPTGAEARPRSFPMRAVGGTQGASRLLAAPVRTCSASTGPRPAAARRCSGSAIPLSKG